VSQIIETPEPHHVEMWGRHTVALKHHLATSELFSDEALARRLDDVDPRLVGIKTMGEHCLDPSAWYRCTREGVSGAELLDAVRRGRVWVNVSAVHEADPALAAVLDGLYDELEAEVPGFRAFKRRLGLLISSPGAHVVYHADPFGQGLVQLRGRKRVWLYPPVEPFLPARSIEDIVRGVTEEDLAYEPWFDEYAEVRDLEPGQMLYWALNSPHRVENHDSLNVSLTTEHWSREVRTSYLMNYGNGVLRAHGLTPRSRALRGPALWAKAGLTAVERLRRGSSDAAPAPVVFRIDPDSPTGTSPLASR